MPPDIEREWIKEELRNRPWLPSRLSLGILIAILVLLLWRC